MIRPFTNHWLFRGQIKREPANQKAFLTEKGGRIIQDRRSDFEVMKFFKNNDSYIFTAENSNKPLSREAFTSLINKFLKDCARKMADSPNLSSSSFQGGVITGLWKDSNDNTHMRIQKPKPIGPEKEDIISGYVISKKEDVIIEINVDKS